MVKPHDIESSEKSTSDFSLGLGLIIFPSTCRRNVFDKSHAGISYKQIVGSTPAFPPTFIWGMLATVANGH